MLSDLIIRYFHIYFVILSESVDVSIGKSDDRNIRENSYSNDEGNDNRNY